MKKLVLALSLGVIASPAAAQPVYLECKTAQGETWLFSLDEAAKSVVSTFRFPNGNEYSETNFATFTSDKVLVKEGKWVISRADATFVNKVSGEIHACTRIERKAAF